VALFLLLAAFLSCNCSVVAERFYPQDPLNGWYFMVGIGTLRQPPKIYRQWFDEVKACTGLPQGEFEDIRWYLVRFMRNMRTLQAPIGVHVDSSIVLVMALLDKEYLVKHEILHFIHTVNGVENSGEHVQTQFSDCVPAETYP